MLPKHSILLLAVVAVSAIRADMWYDPGTATQKLNSRSPGCPMKRQSPIDINTEKVVTAKFSDLKWTATYEEKPSKMTVLNTGSTIKFMVEYEGGKTPKLSGGPLLNNYRLAQIHFHWGDSDNEGSEHMIDGKSYPMEFHAVHIRDDLHEPNTKFDGYAVVGYMVEIGEENAAIQKLIDHFAEIKTQGAVETTETFAVSEFMPKFPSEYFYYQGSLTTPPFTEAVQWIVAPHKVKMSERQLKEFRSLAGKNENMQGNFREVLPHNGRIVTRSL